MAMTGTDNGNYLGAGKPKDDHSRKTDRDTDKPPAVPKN